MRRWCFSGELSAGSWDLPERLPSGLARAAPALHILHDIAIVGQTDILGLLVLRKLMEHDWETI